MIPNPHTALFWGCGLPPDELLRKSAIRAHRDRFDFRGDSNLTERILDPASGCFSDGKRLAIGQWRDAAEFAEHWDGLLMRLSGPHDLEIEIRRSGLERPLLMVHEPEEAFRRQQSAPEWAKPWVGFLLDLWEACRPEWCLFRVGLKDVPVARLSALAAQGGACFLRIYREPGGAGDGFPGQRVLELSQGGWLVTSLPIAASPI